MDACVLCAFRTRLLEAGAERLLVAALRARCKERGWLKAAGKPRPLPRLCWPRQGPYVVL